MPFIGLLTFLFLVYVRPQEFMPEILGARLVFIVMVLTAFFWALKESRLRTTRILHLTQDYWLLGLIIAVVISTIKVHWLTFSFNTFIEFLKIATFYFMVILPVS